MTIRILRWREGITVVFVDDVKGSHSTRGHGSTASPVHTERLSAGSRGAGGYECELETTDGKSAACRINGSDYDLSQGTLVVIKTKGQQVEVHQLKSDLSTIAVDEDGLRRVETDAEIRQLLGLGAPPG